MSNKTILKNLLVAIEKYEDNQIVQYDFLKQLDTCINALEGIPYSVHLCCRDWLYQLQMEIFADEENCETSNFQEISPQLNKWIMQLIHTYG